MGLAQIVLVHDRRRVTVRDPVFIAKPLDTLVEAKEPRAILEMTEPLMKRTTRRFGHSADEQLMRLFGVV